MNIALIFTAIIALYALVLAIVGLCKAGKRSWIMAVVRIGVTVAAALVAVPLTRTVAAYAADLGYDFLLPLLGESIRGFLTSAPVGAEGMRVLAALIASPALYCLVFLLVRWLLSIVVWIVERAIPVLRKKSLRALSMPLGAVNGLLVAVVTLIPLCGYLMLSAHVLDAAVDSDMAETAVVRENLLDRLHMSEDELEAVAAGIETHPVISVVYDTVGESVCTALTTARLDATATHGKVVEMNLEQELCGLMRMAGHVAGVMDSLEKEDYTAEDKALLVATADSLLASEWLQMLATDSLVAMSESWLAGESFAGLECPQTDAAITPTLEHILELLAAETGDTLAEDIHVLVDVVGDFLVNDLLVEAERADYTELVRKMGTSGLLGEMLVKLEQNERMHALAAELKALSIRLVTNMLGVDMLKSGEYAELMGTVAGTLTDVLEMSAEERETVIKDTVKSAFDEQGYDVPDEMVVEMSDRIIEDLGADGEITPDELTEYMVNHADEGAELLPDLSEELPVD